MEYSKLISITGMPGLFELVGSKTDGAIVKSLDDKTTKFVSSRVHNFSHLESIEVYTIRENVNLVEVFQAMNKSSEALPSDKDAAAVKSYFAKVYADIDFDRVYASDMKKMVKWFVILKANEVDFKLTEAEDETEATEATEA
jgi:sugar/nucleoside kinase (ribokinase family)